MPRTPPPTREEFEYILREERDLPAEEQTVFGLRTLTYREKEIATQARVTLDATAARRARRGGKSLEELEKDAVITQDASGLGSARRLLNFGLLYFRNYPDGNGGELKVEADGDGLRRELTDRTLDAIERWAIELANAVTERGSLTEEQQKN